MMQLTARWSEKQLAIMSISIVAESLLWTKRSVYRDISLNTGTKSD